MERALHHAVVLGGSMAGLLAARVLTERFARVTLVERDALPGGVAQRKGVPQGQHLHVLLARGYQELCDFFPGVREELIAEGAIVGDSTERMRWHHYGAHKVSGPSGVEMVQVSRPLLESVVRRRVLALPNLTARTGHDAVEPLADAARGAIVGVRVRCRETGATEDLAADLVVDATGRGSHAPQWLATLGYTAPAESEVKIGVTYTTRLYRRDPAHVTWNYVTPTAPAELRLGGAFPIEGDRWIVTLAGYFGEQAPDDEAGFLAYACSLPDPEIARIVAESEPIGGFVTSRFPASRRRHYEGLKRLPRNFVVVGDAVCSFNPIYGQGMSVSAREARALGAWVDAGGGDPRHFFKQIAGIIAVPWLLAVGEDFRYPQTVGPKPFGTDLINAYVARIHRATRHDPVMVRAFMGVLNLLLPPSSLFHPRIVARAFWPRRRRGGETLVARPVG